MIDPEKLSTQHIMQFMQSNSPSLVKNSMPGFLSGMRSMASIMGGAILVPLLVFYILVDAGVYKESFVGCLPKAWRSGAVDLLRRINYVLGKFICGQLIVCVTIGFFVGVSLWILGIDYAILIGVFSGIIDIIPYVGTVTFATLNVVIASPPSLNNTFKVCSPTDNVSTNSFFNVIIVLPLSAV